MQYITKCVKRRNMVKLSLNTKKKKMIETMYVSPENILIRRMAFTGSTIEEIAAIYFKEINRYSILGYEVEDRKDGKLISIEFN